MGVSTDGILFYGFCLEGLPPWCKEDDEEDTGSWEDWEEILSQKRGLVAPKESYPEDGNTSKKAEETRKKYSAFWGQQRKIIEEEPCLIGTHCSGDYPEYYVAVKVSEVTARRGTPETIAEEDLRVKLFWDKYLRAFCKLMGIEPPEKFQWHLVSYWG